MTAFPVGCEKNLQAANRLLWNRAEQTVSHTVGTVHDQYFMWRECPAVYGARSFKPDYLDGPFP
jgi:hypothetical protein